VSSSTDALPSETQAPAVGRRRRPGAGLLAVPAVVWLLAFFVAPVLIVAFVSLGEKDQFGGVLFNRLDLDNCGRALDPTFWPTIANSLRYAGAATLLSIAIGYPIAYWISRYGGKRKGLLLLLVMLPFWTSYLIRTYAWMIILRDNGVVNSILEATGVIDRPILLLNTDIAVIIGMTYGFLPFAILPLFVSIDRLDESIVQAARDLYASGRAAFVHVTLPLTMPGIIAASLLTFIPAIGDFVTPDLLGGAQTTTIAKIVQVFFLGARDWPMGAALGFILMAITVLGTLVALRTLRREIAGATT
jgi:spermidine/putrescine transport system permease protein